MKRRSFYLSNLRRISGCGKNGKGKRGRRGGRERGREERKRKKRKNENNTEDVDVGVGVGIGVTGDGDTIHRSRSTASTRSLRPLRPRFEDFALPSRWTEKNDCLSSHVSRTVDRMLNYAIRVFCLLARLRVCGMLQVERADWCFIGIPMISYRWRRKRKRRGEYRGWGDEKKGVEGERVGISKRTRLVVSIVAYLATSFPRLMRRERMHVFHGVQ